MLISHRCQVRPRLVLLFYQRLHYFCKLPTVVLCGYFSLSPSLSLHHLYLHIWLYWITNGFAKPLLFIVLSSCRYSYIQRCTISVRQHFIVNSTSTSFWSSKLDEVHCRHTNLFHTKWISVMGFEDRLFNYFVRYLLLRLLVAICCSYLVCGWLASFAF